MKSTRPLILWLASVCLLIVSIVVVGGITRLTHSGLSIVEWKPITGVIPPLHEGQWQAMFAQYQQYPEYQQVNHGMSLQEFKSIFFWEYLHRLLGRLIGVVFLIPWLVFALQRRFPPSFGRKPLVAFFLGGLQGVVGWYMVKSGLVKDPRVSHYRLALHLSLALAVLSYLFWLLLDLWRDARAHGTQAKGLLWALRGITALLALQIVYGAFTAGLRAGFGYNTFPTMNGEWVPSGFLRLSPEWLNLFENPVAVQFMHRWIGISLLALTGILWSQLRKEALGSVQRRGVHLFFGALGVQVLLGILTLVWVVPVSVAVIHQLGACLVLLSAIFLNHLVQKPYSAITR